MKFSPFALHHYQPMRTVVLLPVRREKILIQQILYVNIVLLCLGGKDSWQSLQFSPHVAIVYIFLSLLVIVAWSFFRRILIGRSHPLLHRIENNTVRTRNSELICQGWRGEERIETLDQRRWTSPREANLSHQSTFSPQKGLIRYYCTSRFSFTNFCSSQVCLIL